MNIKSLKFKKLQKNIFNKIVQFSRLDLFELPKSKTSKTELQLNLRNLAFFVQKTEIHILWQMQVCNMMSFNLFLGTNKILKT